MEGWKSKSMGLMEGVFVEVVWREECSMKRSGSCKEVGGSRQGREKVKGWKHKFGRSEWYRREEEEKEERREEWIRDASRTQRKKRKTGWVVEKQNGRRGK
jgi:hypothetical protein